MALYKQKHIDYVKALDTKTGELKYWITAHLRLSGVYWGLTAVWLLGEPHALPPKGVVEFVLSCYDEASGGFGAHPKHDPHLLYTLSALQILFLEDSLDALPNKAKTMEFITGLQGPDGEVAGDQYGEIDARFIYNAIQSLIILGELSKLNIPKAVEWLKRCQNFDGGFGCVPGAESHGAMAFTVLGGLSMLGRLDVIDAEKASWWLSDRQTSSGGLNGRPEKLPDVCYSWWVLSALAMLGRVDWIDKNKLVSFILSAQDNEGGGIADREGDEVDVFHTVFGIAGLSLLGFSGIKSVCPVFCLPESEIDRLPHWPGLEAYSEIRQQNLNRKLEDCHIAE